MLLGLASPALAVGKTDLVGIRAEIVVLAISTCLRLAPVLADAEEAAVGVLTAVEVDRRVDSALVVAFEDPEDFLDITDPRSDTIYLR